jgi:hypothetical protein
MSDLVWPKKAEDSPSIEVEIVLPYVKNGLVDTNGASAAELAWMPSASLTDAGSKWQDATASGLLLQSHSCDSRQSIARVIRASDSALSGSASRPGRAINFIPKITLYAFSDSYINCVECVLLRP